MFFFSEKIKSAREIIILQIFVFFLGQKIVFSPTFFQIFSGSLKFSRAEFQIFSRVKYYFSRAEILDLFVFLRGEKLHFFLGHPLFSSRAEFCLFFSGTFLFSRAVFGNFSRVVSKLLGQKIDFFLGEKNFFLGKKKKHCSPSWSSCKVYGW